MEFNSGLPLISPSIVPPLDSSFRPAALANRAFRNEVKRSKKSIPIQIAIERHKTSISHYRLDIFSAEHERANGNFVYVERILKFLLWSRGGCKIWIHGPKAIVDRLSEHYLNSETGKFDAQIMGEKIYEQPFIIELCHDLDQLPSPSEATAPLGRHLDGCRIGFDLGASDRKAAAIIDGKVVFSEEIPWYPQIESDPEWHFNEIMDSLRRASEHLPHVDAIGGSSAGVYVNNNVQVASLFRGIPDDQFDEYVKPIFGNLKKAWNNIPFDVVNDGEVTALAGAMSLNDNAVLGIAMGSSEAAGYVNNDGNITSWLNELAFAPIDYNPYAPKDEWSGDCGCGVQYFSQQCVGRLITPAGIEIDSNMPLPEQLVHVQTLMENGDDRAANIYRTIGTYFGYAIAHYSDFYDVKNLLILGRVTTGQGGQIIIDQAKEVLNKEYPELSNEILFHIPDESEKRHGQAIAAASLPVLNDLKLR